MTKPGPSKSIDGFSLLEMVIAIAILAISLTALYQAAGGATRIVSVDERMAYAVELARSLVADHAVVPADGLRLTGSTPSGFVWEVSAEPMVLPEESTLEQGQLQQMDVAVRWPDGDKERAFSLTSVVAGVVEQE